MNWHIELESVKSALVNVYSTPHILVYADLRKFKCICS